MQDRRALSLKAHQSESYLPLGRSLGLFWEEDNSVSLISFRLFPCTVWCPDVRRTQALCLWQGGEGL